MPTPSYAALLEQVTRHPRVDDLARVVTDSLFDASASPAPAMAELAARHFQARSINTEVAATAAGNVLEALSALPSDPAGAPLLAVLAARAISQAPPQGVDAEDEIGLRVVRVALTTGVDVMAALDAVAPDRVGALWGALADIVQRYESGAGGVVPSEAVLASGLLASSQHATARERRAQLASEIRSPVLARMLGGGLGSPADAALAGEIAPAPRGPIATFFLGLCGWLLVSHAVRLIARYALHYRRPAELRLTAKGMVVRSSTTLLGKVLRESESVIPQGGLVRATREVRFPRAATYAGLIALALGSYVGVSWFVDGVRASSFSLAAAGLLVMALGVGLDFLLLSLLPGRQGKCRVVLVPRRGAITCLGGIDATSADEVLRSLAGQA